MKIAILGCGNMGTAYARSLRKYGLVKKETLLDLGLGFQVVVSFAISMFETSLGWSPNEPVRGLSSVTVRLRWWPLCPWW